MVKVFYLDLTNYKFNFSHLDNLVEDRKLYVKSIRNKKRKDQSLVVWKLLEYAINNAFGSVNVQFFNDNGKWVDKNGKIKFSLSHSNNLVAVAVSDDEIGVDVEMVSDKILKLKSKFNLSKTEQNIEEYLTIKWTEKESLYKANNMGDFITKAVLDKHNKYFISVCCKEKKCDFINVNLNQIIF